MSRPTCSKCKRLLVSPIGPKNAPILLMGEYAGFEEVESGVPLSGAIGEILTAELGRVGIPFLTCRRMNLWQHGKNKKEKLCDPQWHIDEAVKEIPHHKYVLLMGSECTQALFGKNMIDISGLKMKSDAFPGVIFYACPSPTLLMFGPLGEFRMALEKFKKEIK